LALTVPYLTYEQIRAKAESALAKHHPDATIPIPVEDIVEFRYQIAIIPMPGLQSVHGIEAFLGKTRHSIYVDQVVLEQKSPFRYRFSLAHEIGHIELHSAIQDQVEFLTIDEWKVALKKIPENERSRFEFQAYDFAGLFLVPRDPLKAQLDQLVRVLERAMFDFKNADLAKPYICTRLSRHFVVSEPVIEKRLTKENLWPPC
jgi:Zn-dependent peptidase ImmA (M78 family)